MFVSRSGFCLLTLVAVTIQTATATITNANNFAELNPGVQQDLLSPLGQRTDDIAVLTLRSCAAWCAKSAGNCTAWSYSVISQGNDQQATCKIGNNATTVPKSGAKTFVKLSTNRLAGQSCYLNQECTGRPLMTCSSGVCSCMAPQYVASSNGTLCLPLRNYTEPCIEDRQCPSTFFCVSGTCACGGAETQLFGGLPCVSSAMTQVDVTTVDSYQFLYPNPRAQYANGLNLWWCFKTRNGSTITATPTYVSMETCCDFFEVYNGCDASKVLLVSYNTLNSGFARTTTSNQQDA